MFNNLRTHFLDFVRFIRNPHDLTYPVLTHKHKAFNVLRYYLPIGLIFGLFFVAITQSGLLPEIEMSEAMKKFVSNKALMIGFGVIGAPLIEEAIFRYPLGAVRRKPYFSVFLYTITFLFALIHFSNYDTTKISWFWAPLVTLPQLFIGFLLAYVRLAYGYWHGVLLHAVYNFCLIVPSVLMMDKV